MSALTYIGGVAKIPLGTTILTEPEFLKGDTVIEGQGPESVLVVANPDAGFRYRGDIGNVVMRNLRLTGVGGNKLANGIINTTGANARDLTFENLWIDNLKLGLSLNAYEGGTFRRGTVNNVNVSRIGGTVAGSGYGIHIAKAYDVTVNGGSADRCGRHSLYCAASDGPARLRVNGFRITNHRLDENDGSYRTAIAVARISGVYLDVDVRDCFDGGMDIAAINNVPDGVGECRNIVVRGSFTGRKNVNAHIRIGEELTTPGPRITTNINISALFETSGPTQRGSDIEILAARALNIHGCNFLHKELGDSNPIRRMIGLGDKRFMRDSKDLDLITIHGNIGWFEGQSTSTRFIEQYGPLGASSIYGNTENAEQAFYDVR